jgi:tetratricopeptide (TPR) repeat protein
MIPGMYLDYLRTGNPDDMRRVIYHNTVDILSMVTLAAHLMDVFATPFTPVAEGAATRTVREQAKASPARNPADLLRLGCWHADNDRPAEAESAFNEALRGKLKLDERRLALTRLAALLKRQGRRSEAAPLWEQLASFTLDDPDPFVELAMYHEWTTRDLAQALSWTERAKGVVAGWPSNWQTELAKTDLQRRQERLRAKQQAISRRASPA